MIVYNSRLSVAPLTLFAASTKSSEGMSLQISSRALVLVFWSAIHSVIILSKCLYFRYLLLISLPLGVSPVLAQETTDMPHLLPTHSRDRQPQGAPRRVISAKYAVQVLNHAPALTPGTQKNICETNSNDVLKKGNPVDMLDARDLYTSFYWSHPAGAQHTPWRNFTRGRRSGELVSNQALTELLRALGLCPSRPIMIVGDWDRGWGEEARMLWLLEYAGHPEVYIIEGGWSAWRHAGGPTTWGRTPVASRSDWTPRWDHSVRATTEQVEEMIARGIPSIDARSLREYEGATPYGSPFGGHLPHSKHLPWSQLLDQDARLLTPAQLRARFIELGFSTDQELFTYCTGGIRSAMIYLALKEAGFQHAKNYDGSWWAWSSIPEHKSDHP